MRTETELLVRKGNTVWLGEEWGFYNTETAHRFAVRVLETHKPNPAEPVEIVRRISTEEIIETIR